MANPIFSTYSKGENRVTSTILAVFEKLNSNTVTSILQSLFEDSTIELIKYENQISGKDSVPDGIISGLFDYIIETKIVPDSIDRKQIESHYKFVESRYEFSKLLVLTPDPDCPNILQEFKSKNNKKIIWSNFDKFIEGINYVIEDNTLIIDREKFLLLELRDFIINEDLISEDYSQKVLIVPAGSAWNEYEKYSIYKCQVNRSFQKSSYMGFYADGEIKQYYPKILGFIDNFNIQSDDINDLIITTYNNIDRSIIISKINNLKNNIIDNHKWNEKLKYIFLTDKNDEETIKLENTIKNDKTSYSGKGTAYVQKQTYVNINNLKNKQKTSQI